MQQKQKHRQQQQHQPQPQQRQNKQQQNKNHHQQHQHQSQQQQHQQRHVCKMLPTLTATTHRAQLLMLIATTTVLMLCTATQATTAQRETIISMHSSLTDEADEGSGITSPEAIQAAVDAAAAAAAVGSEGLKPRRVDNISNSDNNRHGDEIIAAQSQNMLLQDMQHRGHMVNLTRQHEGDVFHANGVTNCNADTCVGLSSGTAGLLQLGGRLNARSSVGVAGDIGHLAGRHLGSLPELLRRKIGAGVVGRSCDCRCLSYLSTYREDLGICVDDIHECTLSPFVSGSSSEKIPFVFLPLRGQIIYPSREISLPDIRTPVCAVTGAQYLTTNGWTDLRNPIDTDYPFRMFRDEGRTFLQWLGEPDLRHKMQGRLIVVHLVCRDMTLSLNASVVKDHLVPPRNVFSPCVAFRVNGSPVKYFHNVTEVLFQAEATATLASTSDGMTTKEYVVIGVCSLLLGLIYVSSVFLYLHMKKRKNREQSHMRSSIDDLANEINYPKNDQVTFGAPFHRSGSVYSVTSLATSNEQRSRASIGSAVVGGHLKEEMGIVKNNPLLQHYPQLSEHHSGFASDVSNSNSECETDGGSYHDKLKQLQTSALVHPTNGSNAGACGQSSPKGSCAGGNESPVERSSSPTQESECLPEENVSIVEDMMTEEKLEQMRQMVNGATIRKKLFFNPAYFEPHLLAQPPPAAVDFLTKIREVISIAKYKMATKRYMPSLNVIPEEGTASSATASLYSSQLQMSGTDGCRGCAANRCTGHAKNCGDKRNSIEQWLQTVSPDESTKSGHASGEQQRPVEPDERHDAFESSSQQDRRRNLPEKHTCNFYRSAPKQLPPPPPPKPVQNNHNPHHNSPPPSPTPSPPRPHVIEIRNNTPYAESSSGAPSCGNATTITVNPRNYDAFAALSTVANMYGFAEMGGELYNNPKFILHDSPAASQRSTHSSSYRSKSSRKRLDVLEYAAASTPTSLTSADREHYDMLRNMKQMPDMVYDTIARDYNATLPSSNGSCHYDIPTPDYDSTMEKKIKDIYSSSTALSSAPSVPTPDYSTLSRKSLRQCQPDSPIYRRKSPQYLIVDYETDSLERLNAAKHKSSQSSSSPSSDVSSQLSPSLSTALPLEEELEISHTVYDKVNGLRNDGNVKKKVTAKPESNGSKQKEIEARIKYDTPFRGSMTIEVDHEPPSDIELSTDSDQYEPDTLDRKPKKHSFCDVNAWTEHMQKAQHFVNSSAVDGHVDDHVSYQSLQNMNSLPIMAGSAAETVREPVDPPQSTTSPMYVHQMVNQCVHMQNSDNYPNGQPSFDSIRQIYQPKLIRQNVQAGQSQSQKPEKLIADAFSEKGRLLTLEAKHTRRQRVTATPVVPPQMEREVTQNKTTIEIKTPNLDRPHPKPTINGESESTTPAAIGSPANTPLNHRSNANNTSKGFYVLTKNLAGWSTNHPQTPIRSTNNSGRGTPAHSHKKPSPASPPPPPPSSASTTLNSHRSNASSQQQFRLHLPQSASSLYQHQTHYVQSTTATEDETTSNHSESTEITRVSDTQATSEFDCSCNNTLNSFVRTSEDRLTDHSLKGEANEKSRHDSPVMKGILETKQLEKNHQHESPQLSKKLQDKPEYGAGLNATYNSLRNDYSLNKYLNRRKSQDYEVEDDPTNNNRNDTKTETTGKIGDSDSNKLDVISISSRSNRSSSRLSDRTKEMYRNAGVPVGIAYPQRSSANSTTTPTTNVQTVYRCEIEPVQLTHGMQIAMGLKDRAKKAKDLKNAWKKFVSRAAAKFSPTASPAPPFEKKTAASFLEALERDEGISSLIDDQPGVSTPKSSYSAPANQNYYEQRFGVARLQELDSGYMSADSNEVYKRSFYDRYNFRMMSGRDRVIRVDTIEDNSDSGSTITERHNGSDGAGRRVKEEYGDEGGDGMNDGENSEVRRMDILDSNRFEDFEHIGGTESREEFEVDLEAGDDGSDADSDKTLTRTNGQLERTNRRMGGTMNLYSSDDEQRGHSPSYGSSETDGETNAEDMWESGAESIETHSVLYKQVRKT